jgi:AraC-like DNA-binding protein
MNREVENPRHGFGIWNYTFSSNPLGFMHRHNEVEINFVERGMFTFGFSGKRRNVSIGRLSVFWGGQPHCITDFACPTTVNVITLPLPWFLQLGLPGEFSRAVLNGEFIGQAKDLNFEFDRMMFLSWRQLRDTTGEARGECQKIILLQIEARLRLLWLSRGKIHDEPTRIAPADKVSEMLRLISEHYLEDLGLQDVADAVNLNPSYATTLFRRSTGVGVRHYINELRITHAQRLLMTTSDKIINIALASGFGSATQFYATFSRVCGCTPRQYRSRLAEPATNGLI